MMQDIRIEKVRTDGTKLEIKIYVSDKLELFISDLGLKAKGKRKFTYVKSSDITNDYIYRRADTVGRRKIIETAILKECPENILMEALEEAWERMKPTSVRIW